MTDLVLSVVKDRRWCDIDCYALSLAQSGYQGEKVMFVDNVPPDGIANLAALGFQVIPFVTPQSDAHFQTYRFFPATDFLRKQKDKYRFVFWTDVCDLVFQTDPTVWLEQNMGSARLIHAKEGRLIKNSGINDIWVQKIVSPEVHARVREEEVLCSGTIQGDSEMMLKLMERMCLESIGISGMQGIDQGLFNHVARTSPFKEVSRTPEMSEGFISTCGMFLSAGEENAPHVWTVEPPYFDRETGLVMTGDRSKPFAIAHGYNRAWGIFDPNGDWRSILERRYR
jgi:hypothetical protein